MRFSFRHSLVVLLIGWSSLLFADGAVPAASPPAPPQSAVATSHPLATEAGLLMLSMGGNAFDAAVAVTAVLGVVEPHGSGLGGGGFYLLHRAADARDVMLDARERAPLAAGPDMYLDAAGKVIPGKSMNGVHSAAIPGIPAGLEHLARHYGRLPLKTTLAPAIQHARNGFSVDEHYNYYVKFRLKTLRQNRLAAAMFLHNGNLPPNGHVIRQPELAATLEVLADKGMRAFYEGDIAQRLLKGVRDAGGIWSPEDLRGYRIIERRPVVGRYHDLTVTSVAPPSSGGVALLTMLNILEGYKLETLKPELRTHLVIEAMRRAYRDRAEYLGDPDFVRVPVQHLSSQLHAARLRQDIDLDQATPSLLLEETQGTPGGDGVNTTHFSILDEDGNRVAATLSINYPFGSTFMAPGTGILLNDEMDDFSVKPGLPNAYGLVGAAANAIAPGKRPLSSMSPTFVESERGLVILGTPGGSRIINMVLLAVLDYAAGGNADSMTALRRYHHQYLPDEVQYEKNTFSEEQLALLKEMGHVLKQHKYLYGNLQVVHWDRQQGRVEASSDPRGVGKATVVSFRNLRDQAQQKPLASMPVK
jgi:gamma-glutamyltranspeptidase/glutathione hydrolase